MIANRQSFESGHKRKFLVVIDETTECERALYYASRRAQHTGGGIVLLYVIQPGEFQHWLGVESIMRQEAEDEARRILFSFVDRTREVSGIDPEIVIREGKRSDEIRALIEEDRDVAILVLAAGTGSEGPGPLVSNLAAKAAATYPIPITIVPGHLSDEQIDALA